jgi:pantoate--beta-alanine ligase
MARDLDLTLPREISGSPTVRVPDGLALSSRNAYLSADQRRAALSLSKGLAAAEAAFKAGERNVTALLAAARAPIDAEPIMRIDYLELRDADELTAIDTVARRSVLAVAAFAGTTRLIDNRVLAP